MKSKIENLSMALFLGLALFLLVQVLTVVVNFVSTMNLESETLALAG